MLLLDKRVSSVKIHAYIHYSVVYCTVESYNTVQYIHYCATCVHMYRQCYTLYNTIQYNADSRNLRLDILHGRGDFCTFFGLQESKDHVLDWDINIPALSAFTEE